MNSLERLHMIQELGATVLVCTPSYALRLAEVAQEHGMDLQESSVRVTIHAGEPGASIPATRKRIEAAAFVVIGVGFMFTFYDIFDINVSFIQTCIQIVPGCTPAVASQSIGLPVLLNLVGYVIGALGLSVIADRFGRRYAMMLTLLIMCVGSLYTALSGDIVNFNISRLITGVGIGADLAVVNAYIGEMSPRGRRARYTSLIFIASSLGAFLGIWLGLVLTTAATPFPLGLPFALAGPSFAFGWRLMYLLGALFALIGIILRFSLPESPRWLVQNDRLERADAIVSQMEERASRKQPLSEVTAAVSLQQEKKMSYAEIFGNPLYVRRSLLLLVVWSLAYVTVYTIAAGFTSVLTSLAYPPPEAGLIAAIGTFGFIVCALFAYYFGERGIGLRPGGWYWTRRWRYWPAAHCATPAADWGPPLVLADWSLPGCRSYRRAVWRRDAWERTRADLTIGAETATTGKKEEGRADALRSSLP